MNKEQTPKKKMTARRFVGLNVLAMIAVALGLVVLTFVGLNLYTRHGKEVVVPNLYGVGYDQAVASLEACGLLAEVEDTGYVPKMAAGSILEQTPSAGTKVKPGRTIALIINSGHARTIAMPDLADNSSRREAESRLKAMGFKTGETEAIDGELDWVYGMKANGREVAAGQRVPVDALITLVVGNGHSDEETLDVDSTEYLYNDEDFSFAPDEGEEVPTEQNTHHEHTH